MTEVNTDHEYHFAKELSEDFAGEPLHLLKFNAERFAATSTLVDSAGKPLINKQFHELGILFRENNSSPEIVGLLVTLGANKHLLKPIINTEGNIELKISKGYQGFRLGSNGTFIGSFGSSQEIVKFEEQNPDQDS